MQLKSLLLIVIFFTSAISAVPDSPTCKVKEVPLGPFPTPTPSGSPYPTYHPVVQDLKNMIDKNNWETNFEVAILDAHNTKVTEMENIRNLTEYYNFLNYLVNWVPTEDETGTFVYRMICTMYFVLDQKTVKPFQSSIVPWYPSVTELSQWMINFSKEMGKFLDSPQSITNETLKTFYTAENYNVDAYEIPTGGWKSFNEFFARHFKNGTRPIDRPNNAAVIVSAADSTFDGCWNIDKNSSVILKGLPWSIEQLLNDSAYKDDFVGGKFMHAFLNTYDYHRQHAPVGGKVLEAKVIPGLTYLEVTVKHDPKSGKKRISPLRHLNGTAEVDAPDSPGYQFSQARGLIVIESEIGKVAILPIGMAQVSSVKLSVTAGDTVYKGKEISFFQFGGSDIVYVFQNESQVDVLANERVHYRMGEQIAISHKKIT